MALTLDQYYFAIYVNHEEPPVLPQKYYEPPQWLIGDASQTSTILSLLTPEYQQRLVQQLYHMAVNNAQQWSLMYCRSEGYMRRWSGPGAGPRTFMITPDRIAIGSGGGVTQYVNIGQEFETSGVVPRLGPDIARWNGETVGFWDGETLVTMTSNIRAWFTHASFENSNHLQTVQIWSPRYFEDGTLAGLQEETIFYDDEALVEPVRDIRFWIRGASLGESTGPDYSHCDQTIFPIEGRGEYVNPGTTIEYTVEDINSRPWTYYWENYFEEGMQRPEEESVLDLF